MASEDTLEEITRVKYVGQDFSTYDDEARQYLQDNYPDEYNDYVANNLGVALLQSIAYPSQNLAFYINQRTTNLYLTTSTSQVAISRLARMLNYDIQPAIPFKTEVTIKLTSGPYPFSVQINKGFRFNAEKGLTYEYRRPNPIIFNAGETEKTFEIEEGITTRNVFVSDGNPNQIFTLAGLDDSNYVSNLSFEVFIGPELWTEQRRITFDAINIYEVNYFSDPPELKFGDGVAGNIPAINQEIQANFVITKGIDGAIAQNQIISAADQLVVQNTNIPIEIVSSTVATGGDDPEDLRKVKVQAPEFFQSQNRAITKRDYDGIINTYAGVAKGDAQIIRSIDQEVTINDYLDDIVDSVSGCSGTIQAEVAVLVTDFREYLDQTLSDTCQANTVQVSILAKDGNNRYAATTSQLREDLRLHLEDINDIVHVVKVIDGSPKLVDVDIEVEILVSFNAVQDDVIERARLSLEKDDAEPFGSLILRDYGENLYLSDLYETIKDSQEHGDEIVFTNIKITGPLDKLDTDGNLIISAREQEIIQPGTITIIPLDQPSELGTP